MVIGAIFLLLATYIAVMNWVCAIISIRNKRKGIDRHHSTIPIITVLLTFCGMVMCPFLKGWPMLIPVLDIANLNLLLSPVYLIFYLIRKRPTDTKPRT